MKRLTVQLFRGRDRQFYIRIRAANGRIMLSSEGMRRPGATRTRAKKLADAMGAVFKDETTS